MTLRRSEDWLADWLAESEARNVRTSERKAKAGLLQYEAGRQARQGAGDDKTERWIQSEGVRQARLVMQAHGYDPRLLMAIDNGSKHESERRRLADLGGVAGTPDLFLAVPKKLHPENNAYFVGGGLWIEVKRPGGRVSKEQKSMLIALGAAGYDYAVAYGVEEFVNAVIHHLGINSPPGGRSGPGG